MTVKDFFKSTAFKCLVTLLCVLLVSGIFLTIMHGLLEVTDEEKFQRFLSGIYDKQVTTTEQDISKKNTNLSNAVINNVYKVEDDGNYILNVSGKNGYGGNVLCWVVIMPNSDGKSVGGVGNVKVPIADNPGESFLNQISSSVFDKFGQDFKNDIVYEYGYDENGSNGSMYVNTGASYTMRGISNAVNGAITFMNAFLSGEDIKEDDPWENFAFHEFINMEQTSWTKADGVITYTVTTKPCAPADPFKLEIKVGADKTITDIAITKNGSTEGYETDMFNVKSLVGKDLAYFTGICGDDMAYIGDYSGNADISTGATRSNYLCMYAAAFAIANYDYISNLKVYTEYINLDDTTAQAADGVVTYSVTTKAFSPTVSFKLEIKVGADKTITDISITKNGSTEGYETDMFNVKSLVGKDLAYFTGICGDDMAYIGDYSGNADISTGATRSNYLCMYAAAFAIANYDSYLAQANGGNE